MNPAFSRAAWLRCLPFAIFMAWLALRGQLPAQWLGWDTRWAYGWGVASVAFVLLAYRREYGELSRPLRPTGQEALWAMGAGIGVFALWIMLDQPWMRLGTPTANFRPVDAQGQLMGPLVLVRWLGATLIVPVMEELFWRSFLMRWIQAPVFQGLPASHIGLRAVVLSTFVFMLAHTLWLAALVAGLTYAWLYIRTEKLWVAIIAHAVTNGLLGLWVVATGNWGYW